jgi:hypothetical protein
MARRGRLERAEKLIATSALLKAGLSYRQLAEQVGVARSTLRDWTARLPPSDCPAALADFLQSPQGVQWLHRQVLAAHVAITLVAGAGVRVVCTLLELSGLAQFVGGSYGVQQAFNAALEGAVGDYAREQRVKLAAGMAPRQVTLCEDETFHPEVCLVAVEPVSNFIVLEQYAADRSAATWTQALEAALQGVAVAVVQGTSDEAKGLLCQVQKDLGGHPSPDLFHVQHEVSKATSLSLARQTRQAEEALEQAQGHLDVQRQARSAHEAQPPRGRPPQFQARIAHALAECAQAERQRDQARAQQTDARDLVRELGAIHHPYDLLTGQAQPPERVAERFADYWARLHQLAEQADLPARARERIAKAQRVTTQLIATIAFFFATVQARIEALNLAPEIEMALSQHLIPAIYVDRVAGRSPDAVQRARLQALCADLLAPLHDPTHALNQLAPDERTRLEQIATGCADLFQRSSSCVEGRNGQLALYHHGRHHLSDRKLTALTTIHNYFVRRPDGTTAAQRFFARQPEPLFEQLLKRLPPPPLPARKRPRAQKPPYLLPLAA